MRYEITNALPSGTELSVERLGPISGKSHNLTLYFQGVYYRNGMLEILTTLGIKFEKLGEIILVTHTDRDEMRIVLDSQHSYANLYLRGTRDAIVLDFEGTLTIITDSAELPEIILSIVRRWSPDAEMTEQ